MPSEEQTEAIAHSHDGRIVAKANDSVVEGDVRTMRRLANEILNEVESHKTDLDKAEEISGAWVRLKCDCCDFEIEEEYASTLRNRGHTPEEHVQHPDFDCTPDNVKVEAFCPRHGTIPLAYDECEDCAAMRNVMNR